MEIEKKWGESIAAAATELVDFKVFDGDMVGVNTPFNTAPHAAGLFQTENKAIDTAVHATNLQNIDPSARNSNGLRIIQCRYVSTSQSIWNLWDVQEDGSIAKTYTQNTSHANGSLFRLSYVWANDDLTVITGVSNHSGSRYYYQFKRNPDTNQISGNGSRITVPTTGIYSEIATWGFDADGMNLWTSNGFDKIWRTPLLEPFILTSRMNVDVEEFVLQGETPITDDLRFRTPMIIGEDGYFSHKMTAPLDVGGLVGQWVLYHIKIKDGLYWFTRDDQITNVLDSGLYLMQKFRVHDGQMYLYGAGVGYGMTAQIPVKQGIDKTPTFDFKPEIDKAQNKGLTLVETEEGHALKFEGGALRAFAQKNGEVSWFRLVVKGASGMNTALQGTIGKRGTIRLNSENVAIGQGLEFPELVIGLDRIR